MYSAKVIADSVSPCGVRLTSMEVTFPRFILAEINTHRVFSRSSASSRAIPVERRIADVRANPFIPEVFGVNQRGMQAGLPLDEERQAEARTSWVAAAEQACIHAEDLAGSGVHKQWANRLLEPFAWHTALITSTRWSNFFHLRENADAQPEMQRTAEVMHKALRESVPVPLRVGEWHTPYMGDSERSQILAMCGLVTDLPFKISVARCARLSYLTHTGKRDTSEDLRLHDQLLAKAHMGPLEHVAVVGDVSDRSDGMARTPDGTLIQDFGNFDRPWIQYRKTLPNEADPLSPTARR